MKLKIFTLTVLLSLTQLSFSQSWVVYNSSNSAMPYNNVKAIAFQQDSTAWIGIDNGGIMKLKNEVWEQVPTSQVAANSVVSDISVAPNNDVWITTQTVSGVIQYDNTNWHQHGFLFNYELSCVEIDQSGVVWIGNFGNGGLFKYENGVFTSYNQTNSGNPNDYVYGIGIISQEKRWVIGTHEIGLMIDTAWMVYPYLSTVPYAFKRSIAVENDSIVWIASSLGLIKYDNQAWTLYDTSNSGMLISNDLDAFPSIAIDDNGTKWIASDSGLIKFDGTDWTLFNTSNSGIPSNKVNTVEIAKDNKVWLGTDNGLAILDNTILTSTIHIAPQREIGLYPNPASDKISITNLPSNSQGNYSILNIFGQTIKEGRASNEIDIHELNSGVYFLMLNMESEQITLKFVKK
ncbi:MAG: T9SS type A sorting domain-containing protein [Bacteroidales bacterium]|nr:T9SS type A sorting domain-containing protein [Bacteroidales bacterium]MCF8457746.1 T9SS type A sorting domain-containing protein [Bacteroidales bacterium]